VGSLMVVPTTLLASIGMAAAVGFFAFGLLEGKRRRYTRKRFVIAMIEGTALDGESTGRSLPRLQLRAGLSNMRMASLEERLRNSNIDVNARQFVIIEAVAALMAALGLFVFIGTIGGGIGLLVGPAVAYFMLKRRGAKRRAQINEQLNDLLQIVAGGLSAGQSFLQSMSNAAEEVGEPLGVELESLLREVELGLSLEEALEHLRDRLQDEDFDMMVDAVLIQRQAGGNLAEVLANISWTIRERIRIRGEIQALTGQARMSGWMLGGLPIFLGGVLYLMSPSYMDPLIFSTPGRIAIVGGLISEAIGIVLIRRLANVQV
jgi:tight adherence protein B